MTDFVCSYCFLLRPIITSLLLSLSEVLQAIIPWTPWLCPNTTPPAQAPVLPLGHCSPLTTSGNLATHLGQEGKKREERADSGVTSTTYCQGRPHIWAVL